jgi:2-oxoglutarate dehydrogenase E1 component
MDESPEQLDALSLAFVEGLYADYLRDPESVSPDWRSYFEETSHGNGDGEAAENGARAGGFRLGPSFRPPSLFSAPRLTTNGYGVATDQMNVAILQDRLDQLVRAYRVRGHLISQIDPLGLPRPELPELDPAFYHFADGDFDRTFSTDTIEGPQQMTLRQIVARLRNTYCRFIGVQFMHMDDLRVRQWLQDRMERTENRCYLSRKEQLKILKRLTDAVIFEEFIQKRFQGAKSFSLEGAESLIPFLELTIEKAGEQKIDEIVLAMAHRGRLNVLANIMGKGAQQIFREFADIDPELHIGRGDVKYHLGYSNDWSAANGHKVHLSLCFNPSHLEFVNPVAVGRMRAKQDRAEDKQRNRGLVVMIHGDAAFAGEGIIQETLNLSQLPGYRIGGTLHVVVNNQIGFTTSPSEARSSTYATDVAKMLQIPIFHVNGEDPEAVAQCVRLAMDFRREFQRDVVIDMYCYRRRGHNEQDEPSFTQPQLYKAIKQRKNVREGYLDHLLKLGGVTREEADRIVEEQREKLEKELNVARSENYVPRTDIASFWSFYIGGREREAAEVDTAMDKSKLAALLENQTKLPDGFTPHPTIERSVLAPRREMARGERPLDWGGAEAMALASLVAQGLRVRMSGQDTERGTFSHRHAVLHDINDGRTYMPLKHVAPDQAPIEIYNSPLSENGVLGFEYGYSLDCPDGLVLWEAQFGDFVNAAQVIIDQFIVSAEEKWKRLSGITLLLPHGFEGQGPEHSSARLERFLAMSAKDNIQVCNLTTPAQYFHCLRRQVLRVWRKPLVIMTPKSLLRHTQSISTLDECASGGFRKVIPDAAVVGKDVERILLCSGKIYFELVQKREALKRDDVAIIRIEQLYPIPRDLLRNTLSQYTDGTPVYWVQEEPENQGAWRFLRVHMGERLFDRFPLSGVSRASASSPATGSKSSHTLEQEKLLAAAFGDV